MGRHPTAGWGREKLNRKTHYRKICTTIFGPNILWRPRLSPGGPTVQMYGTLNKNGIHLISSKRTFPKPQYVLKPPKQQSRESKIKWNWKFMAIESSTLSFISDDSWKPTLEGLLVVWVLEKRFLHVYLKILVSCIIEAVIPGFSKSWMGIHHRLPSTHRGLSPVADWEKTRYGKSTTMSEEIDLSFY